MASASAPDPLEMVSRGFFPENLPPSFSSSSLKAFFANAGKDYLIDRDCVGWLAGYNASKRGGLRRLFSVAHPRFVWEQALFFEKNWETLASVMANAVGSISKPMIFAGHRAVQITPHGDLPRLRLEKFSRFRFCLVTDVARCFPSIYSHSIPWAIDGKDIAKKARNSPTVVGNKLDFLVRQAQDGQTIGIPVGSDNSRIISEIVLSAVDRDFLSREKKSPTYLRHVDDYWVGGNTIEECERHLTTLRGALRQYELDVNDLKTRIVSTSELLGDAWPNEILRELERSLGAGGRHRDVVSSLSTILDRAKRDRDDGIIRFAIRKIDERHFWLTNWDVLEHFLAQCAVQFPHSFDYVARVIAWRARTKKQYDKGLWTDIVEQVALKSGHLGHDSEVLWALWLMKELGINVSRSMSFSIARRAGPFVLAYLAHMYVQGCAEGKTLRRELRDRVERNFYSGAYWPLTLELRYLSLWPSTWNSDKAPAPLRELHDASISLVKWDAPPLVFGSTLDEEVSADVEPTQAIEDFSDAYDDDDSDDDEPDSKGSDDDEYF